MAPNSACLKRSSFSIIKIPSFLNLSFYFNKNSDNTTTFFHLLSVKSCYLIVSTNEKRCLIKRHHLFYTCGSDSTFSTFFLFFPFSNDGFQALTKFERQRKQKSTYLQLIQQVTQTRSYVVTHYRR